MTSDISLQTRGPTGFTPRIGRPTSSLPNSSFTARQSWIPKGSSPLRLYTQAGLSSSSSEDSLSRYGKNNLGSRFTELSVDANESTSTTFPHPYSQSSLFSTPARSPSKELAYETDLAPLKLADCVVLTRRLMLYGFLVFYEPFFDPASNHQQIKSEVEASLQSYSSYLKNIDHEKFLSTLSKDTWQKSWKSYGRTMQRLLLRPQRDFSRFAIKGMLTACERLDIQPHKLGRALEIYSQTHLHESPCSSGSLTLSSSSLPPPAAVHQTCTATTLAQQEEWSILAHTLLDDMDLLTPTSRSYRSQLDKDIGTNTKTEPTKFEVLIPEASRTVIFAAVQNCRKRYFEKLQRISKQERDCMNLVSTSCLGSENVVKRAWRLCRRGSARRIDKDEDVFWIFAE